MIHNFPSKLSILGFWIGLLLPLQAQPFDLQPKYIEGQILTYNVNQKITIVSDYNPASNRTISVTYGYSQRVDKVQEDGSVEYTLTILHTQSEGLAEGAMRLDHRYLIDQPLRIQLDSDLKVQSIEAVQELSEKAEADLQSFKQFYYNLSPSGYIPDHNVNVGDTWSNDSTISFEVSNLPVDQIYKQNSRLDRETLHKGRPGLEISFDGDMSGTISQGMGGMVTGTFSGKRIVGKGTGLDLLLEMTLKEKMEQVTEQGNRSFQIQIIFLHQLINEESVSVR